MAHRSIDAHWVALALVSASGCDDSSAGAGLLAAALAIFAAVMFWSIERKRAKRAPYLPRQLRHYIAEGRESEVEACARKALAIPDASVERQWLTRAQLGGLLVAQSRLDEASELYQDYPTDLPPHISALANFGRHELEVLRETPDEARIEQIWKHRDACLEHVPPRYRELVASSWHALEGLCRARMDRPEEAAPLLERGLGSLTYNPARVVYLFHLGDTLERLDQRERAAELYEQATLAFPNSPFAAQAKARRLALINAQQSPPT